MKVLHIITGLNTGGAEMMLYKLLSVMDRSRFNNSVISLLDKGTLGTRIEALGVPVYNIGMKSGLPSPSAIWKLKHLSHILAPDLIQGWMNHGNLAAQLTSAFRFRRVPAIWNIRQSIYSLGYEKKSTAALIKIGSYLSRLPGAIVYNSKTSAEQHEALGYRRGKRVVIANGFDIELFKPDVVAGASVRAELSIPKNSIIIGLVGRYHPVKDHANFFKAASLLIKKHSNVHFILAGTQVDESNEMLRKNIEDLNISNKVHLLGERRDVSRLNATMDIAVSSSYTEGFPNTIGEAMSCGVPCVVTNVGASALLVSETGRVVPPRNPVAMADACKELIEMGAENRRALGMAARQRVIESFSLDAVVEQYESLYKQVIDNYR